MADSFASIAAEMGIPVWILLVAVIWSLVWKGIAWWTAARRGHIIWFLVFFIINTFGILEILYVFYFSKINLDNIKDSSLEKNKKRRVSKRR